MAWCDSIFQNCQSDCEMECQNCQSCQSYCERGCLRSCEGRCEDCEGACESSCEIICQSSCERSCQSSCESSCQTGAQTNRTPGTPSSISVPSTAKGGDVINISWGTASDDNLSGYILERSVNNGSYSQVYKGSNRSYKDTAQKNWNSVRYRVKGYDAYTSGAFKTSNIISVTHNTAPVLIGTFGELGNKNKAFTITFQVDDSETDQSLKATVRLNGSQIKAFDNLTRKQPYTIDITDTMLRGLSFNTKNTINISLTDGQVTTEKNWYFSRVNQPAQIRVSNTNLGEQNKEFSFSFTPTDPDGDKMTAKVYIDGVQIEDLGAVTDGQAKTCTIKRADFITLKNGEHKIRIDVKDSNGSISSAFITFTKKVTWYLYEYTEEMEEMPIDIRVDMLANLADGTVKKIEVCNNAKDASPSWETIEDAKWCEFKNKTKTAAKWALGVRVRVDRGTATKDSYVYGFNISYA